MWPYILVIIAFLALVSVFVINERVTFSVARDRYCAQRIRNILFHAGEEYSLTKSPWAFWPKLTTNDVDEIEHSTSTSFFSFILERARREQWVQSSYLEEIQDFVFQGKSACRWCILLDASDSTPDNVPLLVSEGVDLKAFEIMDGVATSHGRYAKIGTGVVLLKNGKNIVFFKSRTRDELCLKACEKCLSSHKYSYLTPTGVCVVGLGCLIER